MKLWTWTMVQLHFTDSWGQICTSSANLMEKLYSLISFRAIWETSFVSGVCCIRKLPNLYNGSNTIEKSLECEYLGTFFESPLPTISAPSPCWFTYKVLTTPICTNIFLYLMTGCLNTGMKLSLYFCSKCLAGCFAGR